MVQILFRRHIRVPYVLKLPCEAGFVGLKESVESSSWKRRVRLNFPECLYP